MAAVKTYNPKRIQIACGTHIVSGYAEDTFLSIEPMGDGISSISGCDGEVARAVDPDERYSVKITLMQTSPTNTYLGNQFKLDKLGQDGSFEITVTDDLNGTVIFNGTAWVTKMATLTRGKELNNVEWDLEAGAASFNV